MSAASLLLFLAACGGDDVYDIDTWNSPLASTYDGVGDPAEGERIYFEEHWTDDTAYGLTCNSCHGSDPDDTMTVDAGDLNRAAHTTWNAAWRERWKGGQDWYVEESIYLGGYGGQICVTAYFPGDAAMTAEQAAHLEAWMRDNRDDDPGDDPTAQAFDYSFTSWDTKDDFVASVKADGGGWLYGADLGDVTAGQALLDRHCAACHDEDGSGPVFYTAELQELDSLIARIRRTEVEGVSAPNTRMPLLSEDRLVDDELRDLLAALTDGREGE